MTPVPNAVFSQYETILKKKEIPLTSYPDYKKWLRYYLDFCAKYPLPDSKSERVQRFSEKLLEKKQSEQQRQQAIHAVFLYFEMQNGKIPDGKFIGEATGAHEFDSSPALIAEESVPCQRRSQYCEAGYQVKSSSPEWDALLEVMAAEIKLRHYSRRTLKTYANWSRQFQRFLKNKPPEELSTIDVRNYLTFLAVKCNVAASTQNQAFNSLLFLYRHALKREFGQLRDVPRAKKSLYKCRLIGCRL